MTTPLSTSLRTTPPSDIPAPIARALDFIHAHLDERLPLAELAALSRLSVWRFSTVFRHHLGASPHRYICALRVKRVQALMAQGMTPAVAASCVGFYDQSHLTRHFKSTVGLTPGQFRSGACGPALAAT